LSEVLEWFAARVSRQLTDLRDVHGASAKQYLQQQTQHRESSAGGSPRSSVHAALANTQTGASGVGPQAAASRLPQPSPHPQQQQRGGRLAAVSSSNSAPHLGGAPMAPRPRGAVPRKSETLHFEISDGDASDGGPPSPEVAASERARGMLSPSCEEMFDSLNAEHFSKARENEVLTAAAGLATAAMATAAAAAAASMEDATNSPGPRLPVPMASKESLAALGIIDDDDEDEEDYLADDTDEEPSAGRPTPQLGHPPPLLQPEAASTAAAAASSMATPPPPPASSPAPEEEDDEEEPPPPRPARGAAVSATSVLDDELDEVF